MTSISLVKIYADGHEYLCPVEKIYQPERKDVQMSKRIDVRDEEGHLLFVYDAETDIIEIKSRKKIVRVDVLALRFKMKRAVLQDVLETSVTVPSVEEPSSINQPNENDSETPSQAESKSISTDSPLPSIDTAKERV
jgi:hypothetical protein